MSGGEWPSPSGFFKPELKRLWTVISRPDIVQLVSIMCTLNALGIFVIQRVMLGSAYDDNVGIEDILALPFEASVDVLYFSVLFVLMIYLFKATAAHLPTVRFAPLMVLVWLVAAMCTLNLAVMPRMRLSIYYIAAASIPPLLVYYCDTLRHMDRKPLVLALSFIPCLLLVEASKAYQSTTVRDDDSAMAQLVAENKPRELILTLHSGVIVAGDIKDSIVFVAWDKVARVTYKRPWLRR